MSGILATVLSALPGADDPDDEPQVRADGGAQPGTDATGDAPLDRLAAYRRRSEFLESAPFWMPWFLLAALFVYGAVGWNLLISLTDYEGFLAPGNSIDYSSLDLEMYLAEGGDSAAETVGVFHSQAFIDATQNTLVLMVTFTVVCLLVGLVLAILLDRNIRFEDGLRNIYLLPMSLSFVVTAQFWLWMYDAENGLVNLLLGTVGWVVSLLPFVQFSLGPFDFIGNPDLALFAVIFALIWQFSGYTMVVYLAALRGIPDAHYEAAKVDGASTLKMYWRVIIPQLKNATISASVLLMVFALKAFDFLYSLTGRFRPPNGTDILATLMVRQAFVQSNWAYGSAVAIVLFGMALVIIGPYLFYQYRQGIL